MMRFMFVAGHNLKAVLGTALLSGTLASCTPSLPLSNNTPPLILTAAAVAGVHDERGRFREVLCAIDAERGYYKDLPCNKMLHQLNFEPPGSGEPVALGQVRTRLKIRIVPGIFGECVTRLATPFLDAIDPRPGNGYKLDQFGIDVAALHVSGRSSSARNAEEIREQLRAMNLQPGEHLVLIGHSKGMSDLLELIGGDRSAVPLGSSIVSLTGVVAGTPLADHGEAAYRLVNRIPLPGCGGGDGGGVESLTRRHRLNYLAQHPLPADLRYYSIPAYTARARISAGMKASQAMLAKIDARNDGNVIFHDSIIPGSVVLGYLNADHWAVAMPFEIYAPRLSKAFATRNRFPRVVLLEAIARVIDEDLVERTPHRPNAKS